ncbi:MAG TPA: hypothetical protein VF635_14325 [Propionibacteriaceae bacterium]|jgi:hypothetical protein
MPTLVSAGRATTDGSGSTDGWIEAAPFRAHLRHLMAVSDLSASAVAVLAGISPRCAYRLLHGRAGRPLRRISPETARKLLRVSAVDARAVRRRTVPSASTARHLDELLGSGWNEEELARLLGLTHSEVAAIRAQTSRSCSQLAALRVAAEISLLRMRLAASPFRAQAAA